MLCVVLILLPPGGCTPLEPATETPPTVTAANSDTAWPYWPVAMQIHALTRITVDRREEVPVLEARVEFLDIEGATTKAVGQVLLELTDPSAAEIGDLPSEVWTVDLRDLQVNATHFDDVTRTYLFKLRLDPERSRHRPQLRVTYHGENGVVLTDRTAVRPFVIDAPADESDDGADNAPTPPE